MQIRLGQETIAEHECCLYFRASSSHAPQTPRVPDTQTLHLRGDFFNPRHSAPHASAPPGVSRVPAISTDAATHRGPKVDPVGGLAHVIF